jgi:SEC-C motif
MQLTLPERGKPEGRLLMEQGDLAGHGYRVKVQVCGNPVCECRNFTLHCWPETEPATPKAPAPLNLELELAERVLVNPGMSEATPSAALARALMNEITDEQWLHLWSYFFTLKAIYTDQADLDEVEAHFPRDASKGSMVGYYEILPFARPVNFTEGEQTWIFDDQYCLRPDCKCRAAVLQCFLISPAKEPAEPKGPDLSVRYQYDSQRFEVLEASGDQLSPRGFLEAMRKVQPDFDAFLAKRHEQLRQLYRGFLKRTPPARRGSAGGAWDIPEPAQVPAAAPVKAPPRPGRNEPCPCGSGKKYKKCCGQN